MGVAIAQGILLIFFIIFFASIGIVLLFTKKGKIRVIAVSCVVVVFFGPFVAFAIYSVWEHFLEQIKIRPAKKVFHARCATAGEKVYKTVDDVEGILLLNVRGPEEDNNNLYWPDAALPYEGTKDRYIRKFLGKHSFGEYRVDTFGNTKPVYKYDFLYVDIKEGDKFMRYRVYENDGSGFNIEPSPPELARYAVSFINNENTEDRKIGIASTSITIEDTLTGEKMAEMVLYTFLHEFFSKGWVYWPNSRKCPNASTHYPSTMDFVTKVIKPKQEY